MILKKYLKIWGIKIFLLSQILKFFEVIFKDIKLAYILY